LKRFVETAYLYHFKKSFKAQKALKLQSFSKVTPKVDKAPLKAALTFP
jgi:hypothetical protein